MAWDMSKANRATMNRDLLGILRATTASIMDIPPESRSTRMMHFLKSTGECERVLSVAVSNHPNVLVMYAQAL